MNARRIFHTVAAALAVPAAIACADPATQPAAAAPPAAGGAAAAATPEVIDRPVGRWSLTGRPEQLLGRLQRGEDPEPLTDPLRTIATDMGGLVVKLGDYRTDQPVQAQQAHVVKTLDTVIRELEKQCKGSKAGSGGGRPLASSVLAGGPGGQGLMIDPKQGDKQWASLPAKQREQILQSQTEGFPPGYEAILQSYYRRLSQEQVPADGTTTPAATPPSTPAPANAAAAATPPSNP